MLCENGQIIIVISSSSSFFLDGMDLLVGGTKGVDGPGKMSCVKGHVCHSVKIGIV